MTYGVDGLRYAFTGLAHFTLATDFIVLIGLVAIFMAIGAYLFSKIQI
jgi:ABC-type polysaccharide/polyol phosphate export permease